MSDLIARLYSESDQKDNNRAWNVFPLLSPAFSFLRTSTTVQALQQGDRSFPLHAVQFVLFPDEDEYEANRNMLACINRGIEAINSLTETHLGSHLDDNVRELLIPFPVSEPFHLFDFVHEARAQWERGTMRVRRIEPGPRELAYRTIRALELGYRVGTIDISPDVQNSLMYFDQVIARLTELIGFTYEKHALDIGLGTRYSRYNTLAGVHVYAEGDAPIRARLKYIQLAGRNYTSLLMKMYNDLEYPNEIRDYIGVELIVADEERRDRLIDYIRAKTRLGGAIEAFKDTTKGAKLSKSSSDRFGVKKFILRVPARLNQPIELSGIDKLDYEAVPVEIQLLTLEDVRVRKTIPDVSHTEYKKKQYAKVFPILFPRDIYEPLIKARMEK